VSSARIDREASSGQCVERRARRRIADDGRSLAADGTVLAEAIRPLDGGGERRGHGLIPLHAWLYARGTRLDM
jgi:hypothetical protein